MTPPRSRLLILLIVATQMIISSRGHAQQPPAPIHLRFPDSVDLTGLSIRYGKAQESAKPPAPYEDFGACPFEGCVYREWTANARVTVRADRNPAARVLYTIRKGERVTALTGVVVIVKPGRVEFPASVTLDTSSGRLEIRPGQSLYLLTYRGEGFFTVWFQGQLYDDVDGSSFYNGVCDFQPARCTGKIVEPTESIWWVQVRNRRGQTGWTSDPNQFDGKDALAWNLPRSEAGR